MPALYEPTPSTGFERLAAAAAHGSLLLGVPVLLPLAVWLLFPVVQPGSEYVRRQALQALVFHVVVSIVVGGLFAVAVAMGLFGILQGALSENPELPSTWWMALLALLAVSAVVMWASVLELVATVKAFQGKPYSLPVVKGWV